MFPIPITKSYRQAYNVIGRENVTEGSGGRERGGCCIRHRVNSGMLDIGSATRNPGWHKVTELVHSWGERKGLQTFMKTSLDWG